LKQYQAKQESDTVIAEFGLIIHPNWPWLGCSPDGLVYDIERRNVVGCIEIKCPDSKRDLTIEECCQDG